MGKRACRVHARYLFAPVELAYLFPRIVVGAHNQPVRHDSAPRSETFTNPLSYGMSFSPKPPTALVSKPLNLASLALHVLRRFLLDLLFSAKREKRNVRTLGCVSSHDQCCLLHAALDRALVFSFRLLRMRCEIRPRSAAFWKHRFAFAVFFGTPCPS